jgi:hypothetical protein
MVSGATLAAGIFALFFSHYTGGSQLEEYTVIHQTGFVLALKSTFLVAALIGFCGSVLSALRA